jgi:glycosyltransferase involved in cell wall biosynthesis
MDKVHDSMLTGVKYKVIYNAIPLDLFSPGAQDAARHELGLPQTSQVVLLTAHNVFKDYATMEAALSRLQTNSELIFICLGNATPRPTRRVGQGEMRYLPFIHDPQQLALWYRAADVYLHAAHDEAFGKSIAEAMACGTPVVATATGGIPELITNGLTGYLAQPGDVDTLAEKVSLLLNDPNKRREIGAQAAREAKLRFGLDRQVNEFLEWYREVIDDWQSWRYNNVK